MKCLMNFVMDSPTSAVFKGARVMYVTVGWFVYWRDLLVECHQLHLTL